MKILCALNFSAVAIIFHSVFVCNVAPLIIYKYRNQEGESIPIDSTTQCKEVPYPIESTEYSEEQYNSDYPFSYGSLTSESDCVAIFRSKNCTFGGYLVRDRVLDDFTILETNHTNMEAVYPLPIWSVRDCTNMEKRAQFDLELYQNENFTGQKETMHSICLCEKVPLFSGGLRAFKTYGKCFMFFTTAECFGEPNYITTTIDGNVSNEIPWQSVKPCYHTTKCKRLKTTIFLFEPVFNITTLLEQIKQSSLSDMQTVINDGIGKVTRIVAFEHVVEETAEFEVSNGVRQTTSVSKEIGFEITNEIEGTVGASIPGGPGASVTAGISAKVASALSTSMESDSGSTTTNKTEVQMKKLFKVEKKLVVPACTRYEVNSIVQMVDNLELDYRLLFLITGNSPKTGKMRSDEIIAILNEDEPSELTFLPEHERANEYAVVAESFATLRASYGLSSTVNAKGEAIDDCYRRHQQCSCKP